MDFDNFFQSCVSTICPDQTGSVALSPKDLPVSADVIERVMFERFCTMRRLANRKYVVVNTDNCMEIHGPFMDEVEAQLHLVEFECSANWEIVEMLCQ